MREEGWLSWSFGLVERRRVIYLVLRNVGVSPGEVINVRDLRCE